MSRKKFCEPCEAAYVPAKDGDCPECGAGMTPIPRENPREKWDDDGVKYADPRDVRDGRE